MSELIVAAAATTGVFALTSIVPIIKAKTRAAKKKKHSSGSNDKYLTPSLRSIYANESDTSTHQTDDMSYESNSMNDALIVDFKHRRSSYITSEDVPVRLSQPEDASARFNRYVKRNSSVMGDFMLYGDTTDDVDQQIDDMLAV